MISSFFPYLAFMCYPPPSNPQANSAVARRLCGDVWLICSTSDPRPRGKSPNSRRRIPFRLNGGWGTALAAVSSGLFIHLLLRLGWMCKKRAGTALLFFGSSLTGIVLLLWSSALLCPLWTLGCAWLRVTMRAAVRVRGMGGAWVPVSRMCRLFFVCSVISDTWPRS